MNPKRFALLIPLALLWLLLGSPGVAYADDLTVCPDGPPACDYAVIQEAVDAAAPGDVVKVATGVYTDVNAYGGLAQVVYLSKTVTIRGGYTVDFVDPPDPEANPTTLDALGTGRVLYITGAISPTVKGLRMTGGDATALNGNGGGVFVVNATATLSHNLVFSNTASRGGGFYLNRGPSILDGNVIVSNTTTSSYWGGCVHLQRSNALLRNNTISSNNGRGLYLSYSAAAIIGNTISANQGGGLSGSVSPAILIGNTISLNTASNGGGMNLVGSASARLQGNLIISNTATQRGGGLYIGYISNDLLLNNLVAGNQAGVQGDGLYVSSGASPRLVYTTIARNGGEGGQGVYVDDDFRPSQIVLTNTIIASHTQGLFIRKESQARLDGVLWFGNGVNIGGAGSFSVTQAITGDPHFAPDGYHILTGSAALDQGLPTNDYFDIDGDYRPSASPPDLGADELGAATSQCQARLNGGGPVYATVQAAIAASTSSSDTVEVAGVCQDGVVWNGESHVAVLTRTLTLRGGYSPDFAAWDPDAYPTILDAQFQSRVLGIGGGISPTVEYVSLLYGFAEEGAGLWSAGANPRLRHLLAAYNTAWGEAGGGIYLKDAGGSLEASRIEANAARQGGGLYLSSSTTMLERNVILRNFVIDTGGGAYVISATAIISNNLVLSNAATRGGGLYGVGVTLTLRSNLVSDNWASDDGAGVYLSSSHAILEDNTVATNTSWDYGGGLYVDSSAITLTQNIITDNLGDGSGGGAYLSHSTASFYTNTVNDNMFDDWGGGGLYLSYCEAAFVGNTIAGNTGGVGYDGFGFGGGVYLEYSQATFDDNAIVGNLLLSEYSYGGGLSASDSTLTLNRNIIANNTCEQDAAQGGGGLFASSGTLTLTQNLIVSNSVNGWAGGGVLMFGSNAVPDRNTISYNFAESDGGGLLLSSYGDRGTYTLTNNLISHNTALLLRGGGLALFSGGGARPSLNMAGNTIISNTARLGGGLTILDGAATLINNLISGNQVSAGGTGSGLYLESSAPSRFWHNTIANNHGGDGSGIYVNSHVALTNTILVSHTVGVYVIANGSATLSGTLWGNDTDWAGPGAIITGTHNYWGDPAFVDPAAGDYHIGPASAALDRGIPTTVTTDIDGDPRPIGPGYDLGADEYTAGLSLTKHAYLPVVLAGERLTYTLHLTNTGLVTLTPTLTDVLPAQVTPGGVLTWTLPPLAPGDTWTQTVVVTVAWGYSGTLANVLRATTQEGPTGVYTETTLAQATPALSLTKEASPDPVQAGGQLTYTLHLTNTGNVTLTATVTDVLPDYVTPGGVLTWTTTLPAPGGAWSQTVVVTVEPGYSGTLTNVLRATTQEGVTGVYTETSGVVLTPPGTPVLLAPPDGIITTAQVLTLSWAVGAGNPPAGYNLDLDGATITTTTTSSATLLPIGVHTWTVRAFNTAGYSDWATAWTVEVTETLPPPNAPVLLWPPDGTITTTQSLTLAWGTAPGAAPNGYNLDLDGAVVTTTATSSATLLPVGVHTWTVRAFNAAGYSDWALPWTVEVTETPPCIQATGVELSRATPGTIYAGDVVTFSADLAPDDFDVPYTYTVSVSGQTAVPLTAGSADPLAFTHTFPATGTFSVEVAVWNCGMTQPITDALQVNVYEPGTCVDVETVDLALLTPGPLYAGDTAQFSADVAPDDLTLPYTYTVHIDGMTLVYPQTGDTDPLAFSHTFPATGTYIVEIAAWNCSMTAVGAVTDALEVEVVERGGYWVYLPVVMKEE